MNLLLNDSYAPITSEIGFIKCPASTVVKAFVEWQSKIYADSERRLKIESSQFYGDLSQALDKLLPITSPERQRQLFIQTAGDWTAYFDNGKLGTDSAPVVSTLCRKLGCEGVRAAHIPHTLDEEEGTKKGQYGATIFEIYGPQQTDFLNIVRSVCLGYDGGRWSFSATGTEQSFESVDVYKSKLMKDRFTPEMLNSYLQAMGINMFDASYYESNDGCYLVEKIGATLSNMKSFSLKEIRQSLGLNQ